MKCHTLRQTLVVESGPFHTLSAQKASRNESASPRPLYPPEREPGETPSCTTWALSSFVLGSHLWEAKGYSLIEMPVRRDLVQGREEAYKLQSEHSMQLGRWTGELDFIIFPILFQLFYVNTAVSRHLFPSNFSPLYCLVHVRIHPEFYITGIGLISFSTSTMPLAQ